MKQENCGKKQLTRLHPNLMHPCQLLFLALQINFTPQNQVLLEHERQHLKGPYEGRLYGR